MKAKTLESNRLLRQFYNVDIHIRRLIVLLAAVLLTMLMLRPDKFFTIANFSTMAGQFPEFGLMALGVMLCMITGGIDLSVVGVANLSSISAALIIARAIPKTATLGQALPGIFLAIACAVLIGTMAGILNGLLISKVNIPPILATLGSYELFIGIAIILTKGKPISGLPLVYSQLVAGKIFGKIPVPVIIFVIVAIAVGWLLNKTTFGTKIYCLGTNLKAAGFSGLKTDLLIIKTYMLSGIISSLAGLVMLANYNSAKADYGVVYTLQCVLIVVLGGVNPNGGHGKVGGVCLAILVLQMLSSGLNMFPQISSFYKPLIWGSVLLIVMLLNYKRQRNK